MPELSSIEQWERVIQRWKTRVIEAADAISEYERLDAMTKPVKASLMKEFGAGGISSITAQEREAYASDEYADHLRQVSEARKRMEVSRGLRDIAKGYIEIWRTLESSKRAEMTMR